MSSRNVWRNKRRTLITAASVLFAVFFAGVMKSMQIGAWDYMVHNVVGFHTGYLQIHSKGYWDDQTLNNTMSLSEVKESISDFQLSLVPRVENFSLVSYKKKTRGVLVVGTDPIEESKLTELQNRLVQGEFLSDSLDILLSQGLSDYLKASVGDSIVLLSQGRHGSNAAGIFKIKGIVRFGSPDLNKRMTYLSLADAQELFNMYGMVSSLVVNIPNEDSLALIKTGLRNHLNPDEYEVMDYKELLPDLMEAREVDVVGNEIILAILYLIIGFGIFGTLLMMVRERQYEFGVLKAIGLKSHHLYSVVWLESIIIALIGAVAGTTLAVPIIYYFQENPIEFTGDMAKVYEGYGMEPIFPFVLDIGILLQQAIIVVLLTTFLSIYAYFKIRKLKAVEAMRA
jgi:ABC-type lipoprotein release transport system permease subunit